MHHNPKTMSLVIIQSCLFDVSSLNYKYLFWRVDPANRPQSYLYVWGSSGSISSRSQVRMRHCVTRRGLVFTRLLRLPRARGAGKWGGVVLLDTSRNSVHDEQKTSTSTENTSRVDGPLAKKISAHERSTREEGAQHGIGVPEAESKPCEMTR